MSSTQHDSTADASANASPSFVPGTKVRVTQQVQHKGWTASITGTVKKHEQRKTGSWFAHAKDDKLWLDRLIVVKDDGEVVMINLDGYTRVEVLG